MGKISADPGWTTRIIGIFESLETIFGLKQLKFFDADPGWNKFGSRIRDKHPGSATLLSTIHQFPGGLPGTGICNFLAVNEL
jgi:hypothetical protein